LGANFRTVATKKKKPWVNYTKAVYEKKEKKGKKIAIFYPKKSHLTIYRQ
jgi:hypothetical protein